MDRVRFDRERNAVQEELKAAGQDIEIPDPDSTEYLSTFLTLQRTHPRLAARLAGAEQSDPADLLDPYTPRASKITVKHRWNSFLEKNFMRRGMDRKLVLNRQRVFKTGLYTVGGIMVAGLIWSVVAPKPAAASDLTASSAATQETVPGPVTDGAALPSPNTSTDTSGAFTVVSDADTGTGSSAPTETDSVTPASKSAPAPFASDDTPPKPVTTASVNTPPPPDVFNEVSRNDPYAPVADTTAFVPPPPPAPLPYADDAPAPIAMTPTAPPVMRSAPFGGDSAMPEPAQAVDTRPSPIPPPLPADPAEVESPFAAAPMEQESPTPVAEQRVTPVAPAPAEVTAPFAPFGGEAAPNPTPAPQQIAQTPVPQTSSEEPPVRGAAMIYQARREPQPLPKSSLMYQRPAEENAKPKTALIYAAQKKQNGQDTKPNAAMIYEAQGRQDAGDAAGGGSLTYQRTAAVGSAAGSGKGTGSLLYQGQPKPSGGDAQPEVGANAPAAFAQTPDPDAPRFAPTSVIQGKLFSNIRTAAGLAVPVIVVSTDGNWVGVAAYNTQLGWVDMRFTSFVLNKNGKSYPVDASAYQKGQNGTVSEGVGANIHPIAPTLAVDLARAGINSLNSYTQALQNAGTTSTNGSLITTTRQAPELVQVVRGEIGKVFALPEGNVSIRVVADVAAGTDIQVVYGVSSVPTE